MTPLSTRLVDLTLTSPVATASERVPSSVVAAVEPFHPMVEQLHVLRSELMRRWFHTDVGQKVLAITSAERNEGRSFIAANLAVVFAQSGARTVLIDADLRHPRQGRLFELEESASSAVRRGGLSDVLAGHATAAAVTVGDVTRNLSVMPAGAATPNPHELLNRPALGKLLNDLASECDLIIVDTPAARYYADAQILASRAGSAVVLARKDVTSAPDLARLANSLQHSGVKLVGSVFNQVRRV